MSDVSRHRALWKPLLWLTGGFLRRKFAYAPERGSVGEPCLVISNHVTNWDPLLLAQSFPNDQMYFVASEHIFRLGLVSSLIRFLVDPIARSKAASGVDAARECIRRIRAGSSVCLFAEGDCTWDGRSADVFPATGKLAKTCGGALVTYRFEGSYLTAPRWGKGVRRGAMRGGVVNVYDRETLRSMTAAEVDAAINRDIYEDAWARQKIERVEYLGKTPAEKLENALFICPECSRVGTLASRGDVIECPCGFRRAVTKYGTFEPAEPFENVAEWDLWQRERLALSGFDFGASGFHDDDMTLSEITPDHAQQTLCRGALAQTPDGLTVGERSFLFADITDMSIVKSKVLLFYASGRYYEIRSKTPMCLRKYLLSWRAADKHGSRAETQQ